MKKMRECPVCGQPILGRKDKKYCSDICRYEANNEAKLSRNQILILTNAQLRENRAVLRRMCPEGKATIRKSVLERMGFDCSVFTTIYVTQARNVYYLSYDYGFMAIVEKGIEKALIVNRQEFMKKWDPWKRIKNHPYPPQE